MKQQTYRNEDKVKAIATQLYDLGVLEVWNVGNKKRHSIKYGMSDKLRRYGIPRSLQIKTLDYLDKHGYKSAIDQEVRRILSYGNK